MIQLRLMKNGLFTFLYHYHITSFACCLRFTYNSGNNIVLCGGQYSRVGNVLTELILLFSPVGLIYNLVKRRRVRDKDSDIGEEEDKDMAHPSDDEEAEGDDEDGTDTTSRLANE